MKLSLRTAVVCAFGALAAVCLAAGAASAQVPIGFNWSEQLALATDSGGVLLDTNATATVIWDKDGSGLAGWSPTDPFMAGDEVVLDFSDNPLTASFGSGPFRGHFVGNWTADDNDPWTQDGESLYLLAYVPGAFSSSGGDEYGVSALIAITGWPNNGPAHDIVGGGPIVTQPVPEPATILLAAGGLGLLFFRRKK
jgi:hypothetical protein